MPDLRAVPHQNDDNDMSKMALALRMAGFSLADLADRDDSFGTPEAARSAIETELSRNGGGTDDRALELARLDAVQRAFWRKALAGDAAAARIVLAISAQRSRLLEGSTEVQQKISPLQAVRDAM